MIQHSRVPDALFRLVCIGLGWLLGGAAFLPAQTIGPAPVGGTNLTAEEVLNRTEKTYRELRSYSAEIAMRQLSLTRPNDDASPPSDPQTSPINHTLFSFRFLRPDDYYLRYEVFHDTTANSNPQSPSNGRVLYKSGAGSSGHSTTLGNAITTGKTMTQPVSTGLGFQNELHSLLAATNESLVPSWLVDGTIRPKPPTSVMLGGEATWKGEPVYKVWLTTATGRREELWISQHSFLLLRAIVITVGPGPRGGAAGVNRPFEIYESVFRQSASPDLTDHDFVFDGDRAIAPKTEQEIGLGSEWADLLTFAGLPDDMLSAAVANKPAAKPAPAAKAMEEQQLSAEQMASVVMIEGDKGVATGFIAKVRDIEFVVTNLHVLGNNQKISIKNLRGEPIAVQGIIGAVGSDIALLRITTPNDETMPPLPMAANVLTSSKIGDKVVVVGNRLGGGVATQTSGRIIGLGPNRVEVDAAFQPGNSGSPIFNVTDREVIGVAAYAETVTVQLGNNKSDSPSKSDTSANDLPRETRWFGYRLDAVSKWETIDWTQWQSQLQQVNTFRENSLAIRAFFRANSTPPPADARLRTILDRYETRYRQPGLSHTAKTEENLTLLSSLMAYASDGVKELKEGAFYDYFRSSLYWETSIPDQLRIRELILQFLKDEETRQRGLL